MYQCVECQDRPRQKLCNRLIIHAGWVLKKLIKQVMDTHFSEPAGYEESIGKLVLDLQFAPSRLEISVGCMSWGKNDRLMVMRLVLRGQSNLTFISSYAPAMTNDMGDK